MLEKSVESKSHSKIYNTATYNIYIYISHYLNNKGRKYSQILALKIILTCINSIILHKVLPKLT